MVRKSLDVFLASVEQPHDFPVQEARELLANSAIPVLELEGLWQLTQRFLDRGMERKHLTGILRAARDVFELGIKGLDAARARVNHADLPPKEKEEGLLTFEQAGRRAAERHAELSGLLHRLETSPRQVAPSSLPENRSNREANGYVKLDDLTARLLAKGQG